MCLDIIHEQYSPPSLVVELAYKSVIDLADGTLKSAIVSARRARWKRGKLYRDRHEERLGPDDVLSYRTGFHVYAKRGKSLIAWNALVLVSTIVARGLQDGRGVTVARTIYFLTLNEQRRYRAGALSQKALKQKFQKLRHKGHE